MKKRNCIVDLWRFLGCVAVMILHSSFLGGDSYPFRSGWIYVEFFYILSGYYTIKHFDNDSDKSVEVKAKESIKYSFHKYIGIVKFTSVAFLLKGLTRLLSIFLFKESIDVDYFLGLLMDATLILKPLDNLFVLWFLQALFMILPLFCFICQMKNKYLLQLIAFIYVIFYYHESVSGTVEYPYTILRCIGGLLLGIIVYFASENIKKLSYGRTSRVLLTIAEQGLLISTFCLACIGAESYKFMVISFVVGLTLMLSECTYSSRIEWKGFKVLGEMSIIVYIFHSLVPAWLSMINVKCLWAYITIAMILSVSIYLFFGLMKNTMHKKAI